MITKFQKEEAVQQVLQLADTMAGSASTMGIQGYEILMSSREELKRYTSDLVNKFYEVSMGD